jgi:hypothetical protein
MRKIILSALLILLAFPLLSQTVGNVSICVRDSAGKALPDAGVLFFRGDSLTAGIASGQDGCIGLSLDTGRYVVRVTHIGYEEYVRKIRLMPVGIVLRVQLKEAPVELDEVTVSEQTFSATLNRSSFKIPANVKRSSQDIYYLMATVPALDVNPIEKKAYISGSDNSIITVNNIRRDKSYLSMLKPKDIEQVEIIRSPSARYKNVDGIINIVLSERPDRGHSGYIGVRPELTSFEQGHVDGGYSYAGEKVSASVNVQTFFIDDDNGEESLIRDVSTGDGVIHTERKTESASTSFIYTYTGSNIDYAISPKTFVTLGLSYLSNPANSERPYKGKVSSTDWGYEFDALNETATSFSAYKTNLYYQTDFSKKSMMSIDFDYNLSLSESDSRYTEQNNNGHFYENRQINNWNKHALTTQVNFQQKLPKVRFEEGYRLRREDNSSKNETNGAPARTEYDRWLHYFYVSLMGNLSKKLVYQADAGFDISQITLNNVRDTYAEFTPSVMLRYIMKGGQNISLHYSLTRKTPSPSMLDPVPIFIDSSRVITGNPELKPYYLQSFRLRHEFNKNRFYVNTNLQYSRANNIASEREHIDAQGIYHITYTNGRNCSLASVGSSVSFSIFQWWKVSVNGSMTYNMYEHNSTNEDDQFLFHKNFRQYSLGLSSNVNYKNLYLSVKYSHPFRRATLYGYEKFMAENNVDASYRLNNSWNISGILRYFTPSRYESESYGNSYSEVFYNNNVDRYLCFLIGVRYSFQTGKQQQYRQKKVKNYDDIVEGNVSTR